MRTYYLTVTITDDEDSPYDNGTLETQVSDALDQMVRQASHALSFEDLEVTDSEDD